MARKPLIAAMEDGEFAEDSNVMPDEAATQAANDLVEVVDSEVSVGEDTAAIESFALSIEDAIENVEEAEAMAETVGEQAGVDVETGEPVEGATADGLDEEAAVIAEECFKNIYRRLGVQRENVLPSMESFRSANSRRSATRIGLESVTETIKEIWQKIMEAIKSIWAKVASFMNGVISAMKSLEAAAKSQKERVKKIKSKMSKEDDFKHAGIAGMFSLDGNTVVSAASVTDIINTHKDLASKGGKITEANTALAEAVTSLTAANFNNANLAEKVKGATETLLAVFTGKDQAIAKTNSDDEQEFDSSLRLIDGTTVKANLVFNAQFGEDDTPSYSISYAIEDHENKASGEGKVKVASINEMVAICDAVATLSRANDKFAKDLAKGKDSAAKVMKAIDAVIKSQTEEQAETMKAARKGNTFARAAVSRLTTVSASFGMKLASMNVRAGRGALSYVNACAGKY